MNFWLQSIFQLQIHFHFINVLGKDILLDGI